VLEICRWILETPLSEFIRTSTWGYPVIAAVHVLGIALFAGVLLIPGGARDFRLFQGIAFGVVISTGLLLFWAQPVQCYASWSFWVKIGLLIAAAGFAKLRGPLWIAVIFASRGIAFF
jgi:hypothetical protein